MDGVVEPLFQATVELVELDEMTIEALKTNFWPTHAALSRQLEEKAPGMVQELFRAADEIAQERRVAERQDSEKARKRAFFKGILDWSGRLAIGRVMNRQFDEA